LELLQNPIEKSEIENREKNQYLPTSLTYKEDILQQMTDI
jgi:hypothetical protein